MAEPAVAQAVQGYARLIAPGEADDPRVIEALRHVPRVEFVPPEWRHRAHADTALPIAHGQTISQPTIVAVMTHLIAPQPHMKVLEVGTGSGYQAAVLARLVRKVHSVEIEPELATEAAQRLERLGITNVEVRTGDGWAGWPEAAPFDAIVVTAAPPRVPEALVAQLAPGGRMVVPVGPAGGIQQLTLVEKGRDGGVRHTVVTDVRFVPMTGGRPAGR
ncbi:MAG: protein-L-isoaspartate(D-aspartate) O-methyltransferase [Sphingomonadaceae bacterium]|nr:protein-L-isoaspartate(D-aspartate) O-methyltransferase [Thermaurantiacus sp.]MCS6986982.1 protein-L-isoaspartate(D-aspartate) O-methyltransferase [Sphingomonadaceae bacterium]MDW8415417.1 protein-L-isoaspartate(D-aspartate) O-methyltransferase [Thermaurantiacus sp.]